MYLLGQCEMWDWYNSLAMNIAKKYYIKIFGCQANLADSATMAGILESLGWERFIPKVAKNEDAELEEVLGSVDLLIINTCSVRQKSEDKVYGMGKMVKKVLADSGKKPLIILSGCMVGSATGERKRLELDELKKKMPWVDMYISSPNDVRNLFEEWAARSGPRDENVAAPFPYVPQDSGDYAYVNISTGCDNFCSYCVVPYARGKETSRSRQDIVCDVKNLVARGYPRIMLCGQNVNSWGLTTKEKMRIRSGESRPTPFVDLLKEIHELSGLEELAFISSNPFDFTKELVDVLRLPKMSKYLHIAVQSGNNEVLKRMNRRHTVEEFINLVRDVKKAVPDIELGTDIIVGFPGETRKAFMDTVDLFKKVKFKVAFISIYSPRKGTVAERLYKDDIDRKEKKWRHSYLTKIWRESLKNDK